MFNNQIGSLSEKFFVRYDAYLIHFNEKFQRKQKTS